MEVGHLFSNLNMAEKYILNWINGKEVNTIKNEWIDKYNPHSGVKISNLALSYSEDVECAVNIADEKFALWSSITPVKRGQILTEIVSLLRRDFEDLANCVSVETGKPLKDARSEMSAAILQGEFFAGEGMRMYGKSMTSIQKNKHSHNIRMPIGVAGLIIPANTPIANIAWKVFPALICGNTIVLKASEDAPEIALKFAKLTKEAGLPDGVFNVIQGNGICSGDPIVKNNKIKVISFTGSTEVGRTISTIAASRFARVSLELGGKNPIIICDDADIDRAVKWACLSGFSNAGQRCAAGSRIIVFESIYKEFLKKLVEETIKLKLGVDEYADLGPVINLKQQQKILSEIRIAELEGNKIIIGGDIPKDVKNLNGYYINPTIIECVNPNSKITYTELFGPVVTVHSVQNIHDALHLADSTEYGLTSAIHTSNVDRAMWFAQNVKSGLCNVNFGTFGSEAHMPFGGVGSSGNGTREPGDEALNVYSELKNISFLVDELFL